MHAVGLVCEPCSYSDVSVTVHSLFFKCHTFCHVDVLTVLSEITFPRWPLVEQMDEHLTTMKLILGSKDEIYAGGGRHLFHLNFQKNQGQTMVRALVVFNSQPPV